MTGFEPAASWSQTKHSTKLSYISMPLFVVVVSLVTTYTIISHKIHFVNPFFKIFLFFLFFLLFPCFFKISLQGKPHRVTLYYVYFNVFNSLH